MSRVYVKVNFKRDFAGPSSAFRKWYGHLTPSVFTECRRHEGGENERGAEPPPPPVRGVLGDLPQEKFVIQDD